MAKRTLRVPLPDGGEAVRQTERDYAFVICADGWHSATGKRPDEHWGELRPLRWTSGAALIGKAIAEFQKRGYVGLIAVPIEA